LRLIEVRDLERSEQDQVDSIAHHEALPRAKLGRVVLVIRVYFFRSRAQELIPARAKRRRPAELPPSGATGVFGLGPAHALLDNKRRLIATKASFVDVLIVFVCSFWIETIAGIPQISDGWAAILVPNDREEVNHSILKAYSEQLTHAIFVKPGHHCRVGRGLIL
jgi:hypothetical protein